MTGLLFRSLVLTGIGVAAGLGYAAAFSKLPWVPSQKQLDKEAKARERQSDVDGRPDIRELAAITLERFQELIAQGAIVVDARSSEQFEEAHLDAPTIINVSPDEDFVNIERLGPEQVDGPQGPRPIVIYCNSEDCNLSEAVYVELEAFYGYGTPQDDEPAAGAPLYIYLPGWDGITRAGLATVGGEGRWTESWELADLPPGDSEIELPSSPAPAPGDG